MAELQEFEVRLSNGLKGTVLRSSRFLDKREFNTVKLSNGTELTVRSAALEPQPDGSFRLRDGEANAAPPTAAASVSGEQSAPEDNGDFDASLFKEDIEVQRVPINRVLEGPVETRFEDGVTIIPVMEERLKVEKQLILREEIRIVKKRTSVHDPRLAAAAKNSADVSSPDERKR